MVTYLTMSLDSSFKCQFADTSNAVLLVNQHAYTPCSLWWRKD